MAERPGGLRIERKQNLILPAEAKQKFTVARSRNGGPGGGTTVSTAAGKVLAGVLPPVPFWFLFGQAKRNNLLYKN